jgi:putative addiction module component (TIGR02574 family)
MTQHLDPARLRALPLDERLKLIEDLWDSIAIDADSLPLPDWHRDEIDRRLDASTRGYQSVRLGKRCAGALLTGRDLHRRRRMYERLDVTALIGQAKLEDYD